MNMKNTVILLIFLLSILGIMLGICYTEESMDATYTQDGNDLIIENSNGTITIIYTGPTEDNVNYCIC